MVNSVHLQTRISNVISCGLFCFQWFGVRGGRSFCWYLLNCWTFLFFFVLGFTTGYCVHKQMKNGAHELPLIIIFSISLHAILAYILRDFLRCELNIDYYIEFGNVHRFGSRQNNTNRTEIRPRPIVARVLYYNEFA